MTTRGQEPLIANAKPPSDIDEDRTAEEDALLTGEYTDKERTASPSLVKRRWQEWGLLAWAVLASLAVLVLAVVYQNRPDEMGHDHGRQGIDLSQKRNLIFMVSDGMGPTSLTLTRECRQYAENLPWDNTLILDQHHIGQSRTRSTSSLVTDSAAGATAFSCGRKSYNGAISMLPDYSPCGSVMEAAKRMGYTTGLVVTTRITDATPAVFASHVRRREMEDNIALQMIGETHPLGRMVDLLFGGGRCHFLSNTTAGSCRMDDVDVTAFAMDLGWRYIQTRKEFDGLDTEAHLPLLGLFASTDFPYEIDRVYQNDLYPSLEEMTRKALEILSAATADKDQGFFIMIEGSRIDHAGHANDPAAAAREIVAYDKAISAALDFIHKSETPTLMVSTSDHETGGLATARQLHSTYPDYLWYPGVLANVSHSAAFLSHEFHHHLDSTPPPSTDDTIAYLQQLVPDALGIHDLSGSEIQEIMQYPDTAAYQFADLVSRRAQTGWTTHGHSGADVNIYSSDPVTAKNLVGNHENAEVGDFLRYFLGVEAEVEKVTRELQQHMRVLDTQWLGEIPAKGERLDGQDHLEHYTGDHNKRGICDVCGR